MTSTVNYTYGNSNWGDQLTNFNGATITYDAIGNPISMGGYTYEWEGRTLLSRYDDYEFANYTYNSEGLRISKEYGEYDYNGYRHEYTLNGSQIVKEVVYYDDDGSGTYVESYTLVYIYDEMGSPIGMKYRTPSMAADTYTYFFFEKNLQGDIVSVYNSAGVKVIAYTYDAWGNCTTSYPNGSSGITGATYNPFRYRGYYYDTETGFYYLQSRYYNPQWGRFLNADGYVSTGAGFLGYNMYAYCNNNPVMFMDINGESIIIPFIVITSFYILPIVVTVGADIVELLSAVDEIDEEGELHNSNRNDPSPDTFEEKAIWYEVEGGGVSQDGIGFIEGSVGSYEAGYYWEYFEIYSGMGMVSGELSADLSEGIGASASAESVYAAACFKIPIGDHVLKIGGRISGGSVGVSARIGAKTELGLAFIGGACIVIEWD